MEKVVTKKGYYLTFSLYFVAFGVIVSIITSFINYQLSFTDIEKKFHESAKNEVDFSRVYLSRFISETEMIVASIQKNNIMRTYIESRTIADKERVSDLFLALSLSNSAVMQLRYINAQGLENIRVDRNFMLQKLNVIPDDRLQNKKSRYYFTETALLNAGQFWHSNVDLNIENGEIERPLKPTFRIATPLYINNKFEGIVIVNMMLKNVIDSLTHSSNFDIHIMDKNGEIIASPDQVGWSRFFEDSKNGMKTFANHFNKIIANDNYTSDSVFSFSISASFKTSEDLKIVYVPKEYVIDKLKDSNVALALILALIVLVVSLPLSWLASIVPSRLQLTLSKAYDEIKQNADIIDKYVIISKTDKNAIIQNVSANFSKTTGFSSSDSVGHKHSLISHPDTPVEVYEDMWHTITQGNVWQGDIKNLTKEGDTLWLHTVIKPQISDIGEIIGYTSISQNISARKIIEKIAVTDHLTGLYNRSEFDKVLGREIARFNRYKLPFSIILIDIDFFKKINDIHGHIAGDETLVELAKILQANTRLSDLSSRWGGEEFVIIANGTNQAQTLILAEKLRKAIEGHRFPTVGKVTVSCGVAGCQGDEKALALLERADGALYSAKEAGRNCIKSA